MPIGSQSNRQAIVLIAVQIDSSMGSGYPLWKQIIVSGPERKQSRKMDGIKIIALPLGPVQVTTYIMISLETRLSIIVDPAGEPQTIIEAITREKATPLLILNTHGHPDHVLANAALKAALDIPACMHVEDNGLYADSAQARVLERQTGLAVDTRADRMLTDDVNGFF